MFNKILFLFILQKHRYLVPKGYTLAVTLEIADATLGGLAMGVGMTTYSHKVCKILKISKKYFWHRNMN